ncbi:mechanosensitive ion channel domain-containing protein [Roseivivax sp. CAU 1753]
MTTTPMRHGAAILQWLFAGLLVTVLAFGAGPASAQVSLGVPSGDGSASADTQSGDAATAAPGALAALLEVLQDDAARQALIEELTQLLPSVEGGDAATSDGEAAPAAGTEPEPQSESIGTRIARFTQDTAQRVATATIDFVERLTSGDTVLDGLSGGELGLLFGALQNLFIVIVITVAVFLGLRTLMLPFFRRLGRRASEANALRTAVIFVESVLVDALIVVFAWGLGYAITLLLVGDSGQIALRQALYLNAFLLVEMVKVAMRAILSPATRHLRLVNMSNKAAKKLARHLNIVVSVLGYGHLLVVPIVNRSASLAAGTAVAAILSILVLIYLVILVIRHHAAVANWIARRLMAHDSAPEQDDQTHASARLGGLLGTLTRMWHWFVLAYLAFMVAVVLSQPNAVVVGYVVGSAKIFAAVILGSVTVGAIGSWLRSGITLPENISNHIPLLETRLNRIVPKILIGLRFVIAIAVIAYAVDTIRLIDIGGWMSSDLGIDASGRVVSVAIILLVAALIWLAMNSWVDFRLSPEIGKVPTSREKTLLSLMRNAATIALIVLTLMFALSEIGLNIGPLLASAGVLGLAIGFGAQKLVQDIITGVFIQFENAINVGDVVTVGGTTGTVEKLTVRSVSLRDVQGTFHIIPFSSVDMVSNFMRDFSYFVCDMGVAYREDIEEAKKAMFDSFEELMKDEDQAKLIMGDLEWFGLNEFGDSAIVLRARIKTVPGSQWSVGRAYNGILKRIFDERGIEIPFPHQTIFFGEAKDGRTQALRLANVTGNTVEGTADELHTPADAENGHEPRRDDQRPKHDAPPETDTDDDDPR